MTRILNFKYCPLCKTYFCDDVCDANYLVKPSKTADIFHSGGAFCTSRRNLSLTLTLLLLRLCAKRKQPFVLSFSREISVFHMNQLTLSINPFCCEENILKLQDEKLRGKKFHAPACAIFNVTVRLSWRP